MDPGPDPVCTALAARSLAKNRIVNELIAGRLTLLEAAGAYRDADAQQGPPTMVMTAFPESSSLDEAYCRSVISGVYALAPPDRVEEVRRSLEEEVSARLRDGTLRLPEPRQSESTALQGM